MPRRSPFSRRMSRSVENVKIVIDLAGDTDNQDKATDVFVQDSPRLTAKPVYSTLPKTRTSLLESETCLAGVNAGRRKSFDVAATSDRRPSAIAALIGMLSQPYMKKSDQRPGKATSKLAAGRTSPEPRKTSLPLSQDLGNQTGVISANADDVTLTTGTSSEDLVLENGSDTGTDELDSGENSARTKHALRTLEAKIERTKEAIKKEQSMKEEIVNEYLQMTAEKQPTARIKQLFEKKNQKSAQNIVHLQRKLENYKQRLIDVQTNGYTSYKQAKDMLRDVGQGFNTIVSKPQEFAQHIKHRFGSADNMAQLSKFYIGLDETTTLESAMNGKSGVSFTTRYSDDEASSVTSGSGHQATNISPHHSLQTDLAVLLPITNELCKVRDSAHNMSETLSRLVLQFESYKKNVDAEMSDLKSQLEEEKFRGQHIEDQLFDLTELHQHEMLNLKQDLTSMEEKIEYRLNERTTDLSDLMDSATTRIYRLEQQQQQQQILSMEMVENATFRTIISKLINVVLAILAVVLVLVSTGANFLSPFVNSVSRLMISLSTVFVSWLLYHNISYIQGMVLFTWNYLTQPWS